MNIITRRTVSSVIVETGRGLGLGQMLHKPSTSIRVAPGSLCTTRPSANPCLLHTSSPWVPALSLHASSGPAGPRTARPPGDTTAPKGLWGRVYVLRGSGDAREPWEGTAGESPGTRGDRGAGQGRPCPGPSLDVELGASVTRHGGDSATRPRVVSPRAPEASRLTENALRLRVLRLRGPPAPVRAGAGGAPGPSRPRGEHPPGLPGAALTFRALRRAGIRP